VRRSIPNDGVSCPKMFIRLEEAHAFCVSTFGKFEYFGLRNHSYCDQQSPSSHVPRRGPTFYSDLAPEIDENGKERVERELALGNDSDASAEGKSVREGQ
jgi:hypothetical protein